MLQDRGSLVREAGGWTLTGGVVDLPESLQGIIAARLDTLTLDEKALIQDAAVVGKTAWVGAVCALSERSMWQADELLVDLEIVVRGWVGRRRRYSSRSRDTVRDSPIGSDARFWSGRLGFESLSRSSLTSSQS